MCRASTLHPEGLPREFPAPILVLILRYQAWIREAHARHLHTEALIDMIVEGRSPQWCDSHYRRPRGTSATTLARGLELYGHVRVQGLRAKLAETGDQHAA
jgi:hypothetical protein